MKISNDIERALCKGIKYWLKSSLNLNILFQRLTFKIRSLIFDYLVIRYLICIKCQRAHYLLSRFIFYTSFIATLLHCPFSKENQSNFFAESTWILNLDNTFCNLPINQHKSSIPLRLSCKLLHLMLFKFKNVIGI